jgi:hypothetical protein
VRLAPASVLAEVTCLLVRHAHSSILAADRPAPAGPAGFALRIEIRKSGSPRLSSSAQAAAIRSSRTPGHDPIRPGLSGLTRGAGAQCAKRGSVGVASRNSGWLGIVPGLASRLSGRTTRQGRRGQARALVPAEPTAAPTARQRARRPAPHRLPGPRRSARPAARGDRDELSPGHPRPPRPPRARARCCAPRPSSRASPNSRGNCSSACTRSASDSPAWRPSSHTADDAVARALHESL